MNRRHANPDERIDIIARLNGRAGFGRGAEARLVQVILDDLHFATHASIEELAARAEVSEPTVTRLARALGFRSTREMKVHLAQALAIGGAYLRSHESNSEGQHSSSTVIATICSRAHAALDLISVALAEADILPLADSIASAKHILIYGTGGSSSMAALELQNRLFRLGLQCNAHSDPQLQRMSASVADENTVIVAFSISGQTRSVLDALVIGRQYGARCIAVTSTGSPLADAAHEVLPLVFQEDGNLYKPSSSRYALLALVDMVAMATAEAIGPPVIERLRRVRQSLSNEVTDPHNPIGD
jgi:DNA-binding MurR/RpiR family transcriptional regulator